MGSGSSIGYLLSTIILLLFTGVLMLSIDVTGYKKQRMNKVKKLTHILDWHNIISGIAAFLGNLVYQYWFRLIHGHHHFHAQLFYSIPDYKVLINTVINTTQPFNMSL